MDDENQNGEDEERQRRSYAALAIAVLLVMVGFILAYELRRQNAFELCLEAGHKNCDALIGEP